ncbi:DUF3078 domain-containing protein [Rufibacter ruber]|uniref:DUF3078 domain-containing protein n=1 Tax=Rufibacter ruber TaxID=1783499 RepID=UPI0008316A96|nr:DUF3078 domain-containing protein [Rufibacter ruber]
MGKRVLLLSFFLFSFVSLQAQTVADTTWRRSLSTGLNLNQAAFSDNWKAGGVSSIALNTFFNGRANYKWERVSWDNTLQLQYGLLKNKGEGMRKSLDRLYLDTKYGVGFSNDWNVFASANFLSQFTKGYEYDIDDAGNDKLISNFLSPGYLTFALGAEYKPTPNFSLRLSPFAPRFTFLVDENVGENERYGVPPGDKVRTEILSGLVQVDYQKDFAANLNLKLSYISNLNYKRISFDKVDHRVNAVLTAKITRYINVNLMGNVVYDRDQDHSVQYSQSLGLGVMYSLEGISTGQ